ncbi:hypothetical protein KC19_4G105600 [Ceratodon purpureus]|uniref:Uncharacterized protein n=1 Tax=Ceratodon purpureus TaxID=3225 RepID=A0A8T0I7N1_CERPU|nr:hypothetical protein KC19_4G105600 [Ceratodon purpureus]
MDSQELDTMPVMSSQPTNSRRRSRDEEPPVPRRRRKIPSNRSLVIVFEVEPAFNGLPEGVFAGQFHNEDTEVHAWSEVEGVGHYRWLQGPMNHLPRKQQLEFIADVMRQIFIFLRWY